MEKISDPTKWREYFKDDTNFNQEVPFDFKCLSFKLIKASENPEKLNLFYTISSIYDFTKIFEKISSALSLGFSDITKKSEIMRQLFFNNYQDAEDLQDLLTKEMNLGEEIYKCNGENNGPLGHGSDKYATYVSGCRTFLRLMWFLEYLIDIFEGLLKDDGKGSGKKIVRDSYDKVLSPHHRYLVRKAVGFAFMFSNTGNVASLVKLIFGYNEYNQEARDVIKSTIENMKKIWNAGNEFYKKNDLLNLE